MSGVPFGEFKKHDLVKISDLIRQSGKYSGDALYYHTEIGSTNSWLLAQKNIDGKVCLAESQTRGKGRRGKTWVAPMSSSVLLSLGWRLTGSNPEGLSLVSGVAVVEALDGLGVDGIELKWPNDVIAGGKKLGGILVEISGLDCVIGVGLNVNIPPSTDMEIDQPWTDLHTLGFSIDRDQLVAAIILKHEQLLSQYMRNGFAPFVEHWNTLHVYQNQTVQALSEHSNMLGKALGVDKNGALLLDCDGEIRRLVSGEISIRRMDDTRAL